MTDNFEDNENGQENGAVGDGPAELRKAYEKQKATLSALEKELADLRAEKRQKDLESTLSEKGLNAKVAKFIPADADLDEWLKENADLFGAPQPAAQETQVQEAPKAPHPLQNQFANLGQADVGAQQPSGTVDAAKAQQALGEGGLEGFENYLRSVGTR